MRHRISNATIEDGNTAQRKPPLVLRSRPAPERGAYHGDEDRQRLFGRRADNVRTLRALREPK